MAALLVRPGLRLASRERFRARLYSGTASNPQPGPSRKSVFQTWFAVEAIPIYVIIGGAIGGASWYLFRLSRNPDVVWSKANPTPWNTVQQNENIKLMSGNQKFEKSWSR